MKLELANFPDTTFYVKAIFYEGIKPNYSCYDHNIGVALCQYGKPQGYIRQIIILGLLVPNRAIPKM